MLQIAHGVQSLHRQLIVHRDLKVSNIYLSDFTEDAKVYIGDFGAAFQLTRGPQEQLDFMIGTQGFITPEISQKRPYGLKCDIFSLGCIMYRILFATPPFWSDRRDERIRLLTDPSILVDFDADQIRPYARNLSAECKNFLQAVLEKDPERRPSIEEVLEHPWLASLTPNQHT